MGADLILNMAAWPAGTTPDLDAGFRAIDQAADERDLTILDPQGFEDEPDDEEDLIALVEELREKRKRDLEIVINSATREQQLRDTDIFRFGDWMILAAGGTSWGDAPGPTFEAIGHLDMVLDAAGFGWPTPTTKESQ